MLNVRNCEHVLAANGSIDLLQIFRTQPCFSIENNQIKNGVIAEGASARSTCLVESRREEEAAEEAVMGQTLSEPVTTKESATCSNTAYAVGSSCMQGWRISEYGSPDRGTVGVGSYLEGGFCVS